MKTPFCAIAISDASEMTFTHVMKPGDLRPLEFAFPLHEFNADGLDASCLRVGRMVLTVMTRWHPEAFARFPNLKFPFSAQADLNLISGLIAKSMEDKTTAHIPSIQLLIDQLIQLDPTAAEQTTIKTWPDTKLMLERLPDFETRRK
jgi:hypothetical protein